MTKFVLFGIGLLAVSIRTLDCCHRILHETYRSRWTIENRKAFWLDYYILTESKALIHCVLFKIVASTVLI